MHHFSVNITDRNMIRFHLEVLYGISVKTFEKKSDWMLMSGAKIFGVPLENVPRCYIPEFGLVPRFLVDASTFLLERAGTVGLFRKSGSLHRIKTLRDKLNRGEGCLSTVQPYDLATVIKQFCRELPQPLFPCELHAALLDAQALSDTQSRRCALQLLSCLLPASSASCLHYLFDFLNRVSQRCAENLMTSSNLAMIFAPCLLPPPNKAEMSEERLELRVLILRTFIDGPCLFAVIPKTVKDSMDHLKLNYPEDSRFVRGNRKRHTFRVIRYVKTVSWRPKVKSPEPKPTPESRDGHTLKRSLGLESFPNIKLFRRSSHDAGLSSAQDLNPDKKSGKMPLERVRRFSRGQTADSSPVGKFPLWRRRISL